MIIDSTKVNYAMWLKKNGLEPTLLYSNGAEVSKKIYTIEDIEDFYDEKSTLGVRTDNCSIFKLHYAGDKSLINIAAKQIDNFCESDSSNSFVIKILSERNFIAWFIVYDNHKIRRDFRTLSYQNRVGLIKMSSIVKGHIPFYGYFKDDIVKPTIRPNGLPILPTISTGGIERATRLLCIMFANVLSLDPFDKRNSINYKLSITKNNNNNDDSDIDIVVRSLYKYYGGEEIGFLVFWRWLIGSKVIKKESRARILWMNVEASIRGASKLISKFDDIELQEMLKRYGYIVKNKKIVDLQSEKADRLMGIREFRCAYEKQSSSERSERYVQWLNHPARIMFQDTCWIPTANDVVDIESDSYNIFTKPSWKGMMVKVDISLFINHIYHVYGEGGEWVLNWFADMVQHPELRPDIHVALKTNGNPIRASWIADIMSNIVGVNNYYGSSVLNTVKFNDTELSNTLKKRVLSLIDIVPRDPVTLDELTGFAKTKIFDGEKIYTRILIHANGKNFKADDNDSFSIFNFDGEVKNKSYYLKLLHIKRKKIEYNHFLYSIYDYLLSYSIDDEMLIQPWGRP